MGRCYEVHCTAKDIGAPERNKLEPATLDAVLEKLEEWAEVLKHDEELTHTLAEFQKASIEHDGSDGLAIETDAEELPPQPWGPSP